MRPFSSRCRKLACSSLCSFSLFLCSTFSCQHESFISVHLKILTASQSPLLVPAASEGSLHVLNYSGLQEWCVGAHDGSPGSRPAAGHRPSLLTPPAYFCSFSDGSALAEGGVGWVFVSAGIRQHSPSWRPNLSTPLPRQPNQDYQSGMWSCLTPNASLWF